MFGEPEDLDAATARLVACEAEIADLRIQQTALLSRLRAHRVDRRDGHRSMVDWTAATLDVTADTARRLIQASKLFVEHRAVERRLADGEVTFERASATAKLADTGASFDQIEDSYRHDLAGVARLAARQRRITPQTERQIHTERYLSMQPSLDGLSYRLWGQLPAVDGDIIHQAITARSDQLRALPGGDESSRGQLAADALAAIAHDSLTNPNPDTGHRDGASGPQVTIFLDGALAARTNGQAGAELAAGPRIGPNTLEEILCDGSVQVIGLDDTQPVAASSNTRTIPPAIRRFVLYRDGGCTIAGCSSRYRLQPHHIVPHSHGGSHDPNNLTTLCWFHHHVAIHGNGHHIDPNSPPLRRQLLPPARDPPRTVAA